VETIVAATDWSHTPGLPPPGEENSRSPTMAATQKRLTTRTTDRMLQGVIRHPNADQTV
jgi:hypothetical protein